MDVFSQILSGVKLNGAFFFHAEFSAPFGVCSPASRLMAPALAPGAEHLIVYHMVVEGHCFAKLPDGAMVSLDPGDVVVFPHGDGHLLVNGSDKEVPEYSARASEKILAHDLTVLRIGGGGDTTRFVCGFMACDPFVGRPIFGGLPICFKVNVRTGGAGSWLETSILHLVDEANSGRVGSNALLSKLAEVLFVDVLRRYVDGMPEQQTGWLAGVRDPVVGKCLGLLHSRADHDWTLADLAKEAGASRSALSERFTRFLSEPPMTYLTRWRLQLAARALTSTSKGVAEIAASVGYESEAAFTRAFKREYEVPPARYRREARLAQQTAATTA